MMKRLLSNMLLAGFAATAMAGPVVAKPKICLNLRDIASSDVSKDGSAITFKLHDGSLYRNDLLGRCPDLQFNGFAWVIRGPEQVCENMQSLRVINSGEVCLLGKFTQVTPAPKG
jgi:hypothetical protein